MTMPARAGNDIKWSHTCLALTSYRMTCSWQLCCIAYQDPIVHRSYYVGKKCMRGKERHGRGGGGTVGGVGACPGVNTHRRDMAEKRYGMKQMIG